MEFLIRMNYLGTFTEMNLHFQFHYEKRCGSVSVKEIAYYAICHAIVWMCEREGNFIGFLPMQRSFLYFDC